MTLLEKLAYIQNEMKVPKNRRSKGVSYMYRTCEDIQEAAKPICLKYKTVVTTTERPELIGERYYITASATLYDLESEQSHTVTASAREADNLPGQNAPQNSGTTSSYAQKRVLGDLFQLDDSDDDPDAQEPHGNAEAPQRLDTQRKPEPSKTPEQKPKAAQSEAPKATVANPDVEERINNEVRAAAKRTDRKIKDVVALVKTDGFDFNNPDHFDGIIKYLQNLKPAKTDLFE